MLVREHITNLETNATVLGIVSLSLKDFAAQIIKHVHNGGDLNDELFVALRARCVRNLKDIGAEGLPLEQEATALNEALRMFQQMMDDAVACGRAGNY